MVTNRSQSTVVPGASNQAYGVDGTFSFFQDSDHRRLLRPLADRGAQRRQRQLPGAVRLRARSLRRPARLPEGRRQLQSRGRASRGATTSGDRSASARFSPRPQRQQARPQVHVRKARSNTSSTAPDQLETRQRGARFNTEFQNSDTFTRRGQQQLRAARPPVHGLARRHHSRRRLRVQRRDDELRIRPAAPGVGHGVAPGRASSTTATSPRSAYSGGRVAVLKQWSLEPSLSVNHVELPAGTFTTTVYSRAHRLRVLAAHVRQRARAVQLERSTSSAATSAFAGSISPAASSSSSTPTSATRSIAGYPDLKNRAFVVKVNRLFRF